MTYESATNNQSNGLTADLDSIDAVARVEAVLVTSERPVREARLVEATGLGVADVRAAIASLNDTYEDSNRVFRITAVADGWQVLTLPEVAPVLARLLAARQQARLSQAAMETLSIIAYRQPVLRAEIEAIRGVACGEVLRGLLERRLIRIAGRAEELGRPMLYGTTREFLRIFGLSGIDDLPEVDGLQRAPSWTPLTREPDDSPESTGPEVVDTLKATPTPET
ncbi:MAG: SMC-Scp complex subunit ScpB [Phycisphaerales bacterium]|nr:SMC-Scp complex subunit ScpB [Phycisphaerales bacterium]MDP6891039.1 SMC-Scp complex subunit ScpB [Phycisphaerales bacterium]